MKIRYAIFVVLFFAVVGESCSDKNGNNPDPLELSSVYVTNEGNFSDSNGSLTSYDPATGSTLQKAFEGVNGRPLAGIIQSATEINGKMFIVLNSADKIEVVDSHTLKSVATISLSKTPTFIVDAGNDKAYVTNLYDKSISVIDIKNYKETGQTIAVGSQPRVAVRVGNRVFVANNGAGKDSTISVINTGTDLVDQTIEVGAGPTQIIADDADRLWVVCNGLIAYDDNWNRQPENDRLGSVYIIDGRDATVLDSVETGGHPTAITLDNDNANAYLLNGDISVIDMNNYTVEKSDFISRSFNAIAYFPLQNRLYAGQNKGYSQSGKVILYNLEGAAVDSFATGIAPNGFYFLKD